MKGLVANYDDSSDDIDPDDEFPTFGCRIIYEMFDTMGGWASMVTDLPEDSLHRNVQLGLEGDNGNIPKSAALAMGRSLVHVVMSESLSPRFIRYMVECVARDIRDLYAEGPAGPMRAALVEAVAYGGSSWTKRGYARRLLPILSQLDFILVGELEDLVAAIKQAIAKEANSPG